jgi:hypothetical protein
MPRYQVTHKASRETWEVEAGFSEDALRAVGWNLEECQILLLREGQFAQIVPPKVAVQVIPPKTGSVPICPDCNVTLTRQDGQDFWWMCPACDLVYHELENQFFSAGDLP